MWTPAATPLEIAPRLRLWPTKPAPSNSARPVRRYCLGSEPIDTDSTRGGGNRRSRRNSGPSLIAAAASQASSAVTGQNSVRPVGSQSFVPRASWSFLHHRRESSMRSAWRVRCSSARPAISLGRNVAAKPTSNSARSRNPGNVRDRLGGREQPVDQRSFFRAAGHARAPDPGKGRCPIAAAAGGAALASRCRQRIAAWRRRNVLTARPARASQDPEDRLGQSG